MSKIDKYLEQWDVDDIVQRYQLTIPQELKSQKWWLPCIGRRPPCKYAGKDAKNLMTFNDAVGVLSDARWLVARLEFFAKDDPSIFDKPPHLMAWLLGSEYMYIDVDYRKVLMVDGTFMRGEDGKPHRRSKFGDDQVKLIERARVDLFGYSSRSGGYHGWFKKTDGVVAVNDKAVNTKIEDGYLAPCEIKEHACFLPYKLEPTNARTVLEEAPDYIVAICRRVEDKKPKPIPTPDMAIVDNDDGLPLPVIKRHRCVDTLLGQYRILHKAGVQVVPASRSDFGGWHKRLTTLGVSKDKILEIAVAYPDYVDGKDDKDILASTPYDDADKQSDIEMARVKELFAKHEVAIGTMPEPVSTPIEVLSIAETDNEVMPRPVDADVPKIHPHLATVGEYVVFAGPPGIGKTTQVWHWMAELNRVGKFCAYLNGDQNITIARKKMRDAGCDPDLTIVIDVVDRRVLALSELVKTIKVAANGRPIGCVVLDPAPKIIGMLWLTMTDASFEPNFDKQARAAIDFIVKPLASQCGCCAVLLAHNSVNSDSRDRYPGSQAWMGDADVTYRLYSATRSYIKTMPEVFKDVFREIPKDERFEWRILTSMGKNRNLECAAPDYKTKITGGKMQYYLIEDVVEFPEERRDNKKYPDPETYKQAVIGYLDGQRGEWVGIAAVHKAINYRDIDRHYALGVLAEAGISYDGKTSVGTPASTIYWRKAKGGISIMLTDKR